MEKAKTRISWNEWRNEIFGINGLIAVLKKSFKKWIYAVSYNMHERTGESTGFSGSHRDRRTDEWEPMMMMILYGKPKGTQFEYWT